MYVDMLLAYSYPCKKKTNTLNNNQQNTKCDSFSNIFMCVAACVDVPYYYKRKLSKTLSWNLDPIEFEGQRPRDLTNWIGIEKLNIYVSSIMMHKRILITYKLKEDKKYTRKQKKKAKELDISDFP